MPSNAPRNRHDNTILDFQKSSRHSDITPVKHLHNTASASRNQSSINHITPSHHTFSYSSM
ncbi:hypothetical protein DL98DRAFT_511117 [Cadophora sp. DSE1049]|nr:hypothetical protein DL98DRAFT_511117 [Cadophora sp. DSE1049]